MFTKKFYMENYLVYILCSKKNGTLYVGVTSDLIKRIYSHKGKLIDGFTKTHNINRLIYYEEHFNINEAIRREKNIKAWKRAWKLRLIEENNPTWDDLYFKLF